MLSFTHLIFALSLAYLAKFPRIPAAIGSLLPDIDYLMDMEFPFTHRGFVHSLAFMSLSMAVLYLLSRRTDLSLGLGIGFLSHLFIDTFNPTGIAWLYPLPEMFSMNLSYFNNPVANLGIISLSILLVYLWKTDLKIPIERETLRYIFITSLILGVVAISYLGGSLSGEISYKPLPSDFTPYTISDLKLRLPVDQYVSTTGKVSKIESDYISKKGYEYQTFFLSDNSVEVKIFCSKYSGSADIRVGDEISLRGKFQKYYDEYEIYLECSEIEH